MSCENVQELLSPLLDRKLADEVRGTVLGHLAGCRGCRARLEAYERVRSSLRAMHGAPVPARLSAQLQVMASKERRRVLSRRSFGERARNWAAYVRLSIDNMMRPLALPFAGGVLSAFVLFSALMPGLAFQRDYSNDVPIMLFTDPALEEMGYSHVMADVTILELTIDERGRFIDYSTPQGKLTPEMINDLLFYRFAPATAFGVPTWGKVKVTFRPSANSSRIDVRG